MLVFRALEIKFSALREKYSSHVRQGLLRSYCTDISCFHLHQPVVLPPQLLHRRLIPSISCLRFFVVRPRFSAGGNGLSSSEESEESAMEEAREAIAELLGEYGVSEDDRRRIACSSPHYLGMIVGNVRELDENSLWGSWKPELAEEGVDIASFGFKKKVRCMAVSKRDCGVLPFLESLGVRQSSAMFIARYLVGERLPDLIDKVKFVKEMVVSSSSSVIVKNARRMMMYLSILADDDIQGTLAFFEKMEARYGGLTLLDQGDSFVSLLIESFPRLLMLSVENHLKPLVDFLVLIGVPITSIRNVLLLYPPIFFYDVENTIIPRLDALKKAGLEDKYIAKVLIKYPWVLSSSVQQNYDKIVMFFARRKVPKQSVDIAIRSWPHILGCSTYKMKLVVKQFGQLSVHARHLVPVITSSPQLLLKNPEEFLQVVSFLEHFGFDNETIGRILCRCPEIFAASVHDTLQRKINILTHFGIPNLPRVIRKYPELLLLDVNATLLPRMRYFMDIGLSRRAVCSMISRFSPLLGYSIEAVFKPKLEFLQTTMQKPLTEIVEYPRYFSYSLDKKIKPRYWVLRGRNITCSLKDMLAKNNEEFAEAYMGFSRLLVPTSPASSADDQHANNSLS